ncbi:hypothetical protein B7463_g3235, partial [Scytalidium lignicola]
MPTLGEMAGSLMARSVEIRDALARRADDDTHETGAQELLDLLKDPFGSQLAQTSVVAGLATSVGFTLAIAIGFSLIRPYNSIVYAPKLRVADEKHSPPPLGRGIFAWIKPVLTTREQDLVELIGLDATLFLRFSRMCRNIFLVTAVVGCGVLIPLNLSKGLRWQDATFLSRLTPTNTWGSADWGMVVVAYIINATVAGFLWWNYTKVLLLRRHYFNSAEYQTSLHARTLMINDIPKEYRSDEGICRLIDAVEPTSSFARSVIARNVKDLPELIEQHNQTVRLLEKYLANYLKDPNSLPPRRPECRPSKDDPSFSSYAKGQKVDAIDYLRGRIHELETEIKEVRVSIDNRNPLPYGFASYDDIQEAHGVAFKGRNKHPQGTTIVLAPKPHDIIWKNMPLSKQQRKWRRMWNNFWVSILTLLWTAPNAMISLFVTNLTNLGHVWPAFQRSLEANKTLWSIVQGVASPAVTSLVYLVLPIMFRRLSIRAGDRTKTARERHVTAKLYTFFVVNYLIVFSVFSTVWTCVSTIISNTSTGESAWDAIKKANFAQSLFISLCELSPFWITWLLQRNLGAAIDLAQLWTLVWGFCRRKFSSPTPREMIELTAPPAFEYSSYYNYFLFYSTVTLCFATIQPLVIPAAALYFVVDVYLKKYLLLYIFITKTESGGMFWRILFNRMVFATLLSNLVVFLGTWVRGDGNHVQAYSVIPLFFFMIGFKIWCSRAFDHKIYYYNIRNMLKDPEASRSKLFGTKGDRLASRFGHPALYKPLITPMVHAKAQNILASVYGGRLTDPNGAGAVDSISGYSDTYALDSMQTGKTPGRAAHSNLAGFELVPENRLDFSYFKTRGDQFEGDDHGGGGQLYGRAGDIVRPDTPGTSTLYAGSEGSRPGTPVFTQPPKALDFGEVRTSGGNHQMYSYKNESETNLVHGAAEMPISTSRSTTPNPIQQAGRRDNSLDRRAPGFLGGGPQGYGNLPQAEVEEDPMSYDYFRGRRANPSGPRY